MSTSTNQLMQADTAIQPMSLNDHQAGLLPTGSGLMPLQDYTIDLTEVNQFLEQFNNYPSTAEIISGMIEMGLTGVVEEVYGAEYATLLE